MHSRRYILIVLLLALGSPLFVQTAAKKAPAAMPWEKLENVTIKPGRW